MSFLFRLRALHLVILCSALLWPALAAAQIDPPESGATERNGWENHSWHVMGTRAELAFWPGTRSAETTVNAVRAEFERLNALLSPWVETSELYQANAHAARAPVVISEEFAQLIDTSRQYSLLTDNAFDITFATVGHLYDYRAGIAPDDAAIAEARAGQGMDKVVLARTPDDETAALSFLHERTRIDLGGIAKGYAIDRAVALLREHGVAHAYISLGGDSYVLGDRRGRLWQVGVRHPRQDDAVAITLPLADVAVSTSGDYERFFIRDGEHVHHILSPESGRPAGALVSVTVLAPRAVDADALSTSLFVLGIEAGLELAETLEDVSAILIDRDGGVHYSQDLLGKD
ncbi:MAG: FAD:protein FMN transferase [Alcanivorax sp.]|nr:FAD:protein FMN transferase [Alcanivorax sp.]